MSSRRVKKTQQIQSLDNTSSSANVESLAEPLTANIENNAPVNLTKADYLKARATIKQYRESKKSKPKRICSEAQLAALAAGREKNKRFQKKTD